MTDQAHPPYYVLFVRAAGSHCYQNEAGGTDRDDLVARANRFLMRGAGTALVVRVVFWAGFDEQGHRPPGGFE